MKKILYLSHADWNWIKQRPQFLAEELAKYFNVVFISPHFYHRKDLQNRKYESDANIKFYNYYGIPRSKKYLLLRVVNNFIRSIVTLIIAIVEKPDVIYICYPDLYCNWMKRFKYQVIYDCMDDHAAMTSKECVANYIRKKERQLSLESSSILCSSDNLCKKISNKYQIDNKKITVVRNGYQGERIETGSRKFTSSNIEKLKIGYVGTVSSWFDFEALNNTLEINPQIEYHIIGPTDKSVSQIKHERIIFEGVVEHEKLYQRIQNFDALIMPFVVNEIIESVDPVKLYEYINFYKPIICVYYDEIKRFEPFVWFYRDYTELNDAINKVKDSQIKYTKDMMDSFLRDSSWRSRAEQIKDILGQ